MAVRAGAAPAPDRRPHGVLRREHPGLQADLGLGYHIREAGSTAAQELAYTLADGFAYVELGCPRPGHRAVRAGLSFFFDAHLDFFEEIAKFRAARRIWARWLRDVYGAKTEKAQQLRFHTQTAGVSLTAQQPDNNITRTAVEALSAILGGTQSLHTNALDEVLALPSAKAAQIALRTQQVIMEETGVMNVADPLGGSWYVEALTDDIERQAEEIFARIKDMSSDGTMTAGILRGHRGRLVHRRDRGGGVRLPAGPGEGRQEGRRRQHADRLGRRHDTLDILRVSHQVEIDQKAELTAREQTRDDDAARAAVARMVEVGRTEENMIPAMLDAVRAEATLGESAGPCAWSGAATQAAASDPGSAERGPEVPREKGREGLRLRESGGHLTW